VALGQVFSEYFGFPYQFSFHRVLHTRHHLSSGAGTIGQILADVRSGLSLTPPRETKKKKPKSEVLSWEQLKNIMNDFSHDSWCLGRGLKPGSVEYDATVLTIRTRFSFGVLLEKLMVVQLVKTFPDFYETR
jgi:hypothetical protein